MLCWLSKYKNIKTSIRGRLFIGIVFITILLSCSVIYWQNFELRSQYKNDIDAELISIKSQWEKSLSAYNSMLKIVGKNILNKKISNNYNAISSVLKQFYIISKDVTNNTPIDFSDITWQGEGRDSSTNRYGAIPSNKLPADLERDIRTFSNKPYLYNFETKSKVGGANELLLITGLLDRHKNYIGSLSIKLDLNSWIKALIINLREGGRFIAIADHNKKVLFSTDESLISESVIVFPPSEKGDFAFIGSVNLEPYTYTIIAGYNRTIFYKQLLRNILPLMILIWGVGITFLIIQILYSAKLRKEIKTGFITRIASLDKSNKEYKLEKLKIANELNQEIDILNNTVKHSNCLLKAYELGRKEKHKLESMLGNRITETLTEIREITRVLADGQNGSLNITINNARQIELLSSINDKLGYLSMFCVAYKDVEQIELREIIDDTVKIYAREILESKLNIKIKIQNRIKALYFDELLLRQLLANLLRESISDARPGGEIIINAIIKKLKNKDILALVIKDNGFGIPDKCIDNFDQSNGRYYPTSPLDLDLSSIQGIAESFKGSLVTEYMVGVGKTITLSVPYELRKHSEQISIDGENIVMFKKDQPITLLMD